MRFVKKVNIFFIFISALFLLASINVYAAEGNYEDLTPVIGQPCEKEWKVKFTSPVNKSTLNKDNIKVYEESDTTFKSPIEVSVRPGEDDYTALIGSPVSGFIPNRTYNIVIGTGIEGVSGEHLNVEVRKKFTVTDTFESSSNYVDLPSITSVNYDKVPFVSLDKPSFFVASSGDNVQYRMFYHDYANDYKDYKEITDNKYTASVNGNSQYKISMNGNLNSDADGQKYKLIVFVKRANVKGAHSTYILGQEIDFDNYYVDYFRCVEQVSSEGTKTDYNKTIDDIVNTQAKLSPKTNEGQLWQWVNPSKTQIKYYINPDNFMDSYGKNIFLKLNSYVDDISAEEINNILKGKGVLEGKGQAFLDSAKKYNINPAYFVSHSLMETAGGTSELSKGRVYNDKTIYNFFGVRAVDSDPLNSGSKYAYDKGWFTIEAAIDGGAEYVSSNYINNDKYGQNTLYKMRWNVDNPGIHQYATDIAWSYKILQYMQPLMDKSQSAKSFDIPKYLMIK